jgi:hypothetical protein
MTFLVFDFEFQFFWESERRNNSDISVVSLDLKPINLKFFFLAKVVADSNINIPGFKSFLPF